MFIDNNLFDGVEVAEFFKDLEITIRKEIEKEPRDYILTVDEEAYIKNLIQNNTFDPPVFNFEQLTWDEEERIVGPTALNKKWVLIYHIPFTGNVSFLLYSLDGKGMRLSKLTYLCERDKNCLCFEDKPEFHNAETIKNDLDIIKVRIKKYAEAMKDRIDSYNSSLPSTIRQIFNDRKKTLAGRHQIMQTVGVPIRKNDQVSLTFAVPTPELEKSIYLKPPSGQTPVLSVDIYNDILNIIYEVGKVLERLPSILRDKEKDKGEEALRDILILFLTPRYGIDGSVTGETFNTHGKTDILIRYQNSNVFVAECKFWDGAELYLETLTQIMNYLTWRDSKAAVIIFNRKVQISTVLKAIEKETPNHPNYSKTEGKHTTENGDIISSWFKYKFHINNEPDLEIDLSVLVFSLPTFNQHIPKEQKATKGDADANSTKQAQKPRKETPPESNS